MIFFWGNYELLSTVDGMYYDDIRLMSVPDRHDKNIGHDKSVPRVNTKILYTLVRVL